jgi:hypothetical protein
MFRLTVLIILFQLSKILFSQTIWLGDWVGEWETNYKLNEENIYEHLLIKETHNRTFIKMEINGGNVNDTILEFKFYTELFLTVDLKKQEITGFYIDDHGFNGMMYVKGKITADNEFNLEGSCPLWTNKITWKLLDGRLNRRNIIKTNDSETTIEVDFIKKN